MGRREKREMCGRRCCEGRRRRRCCGGEEPPETHPSRPSKEMVWKGSGTGEEERSKGAGSVTGGAAGLGVVSSERGGRGPR